MAIHEKTLIDPDRILQHDHLVVDGVDTGDTDVLAIAHGAEQDGGEQADTIGSHVHEKPGQGHQKGAAPIFRREEGPNAHMLAGTGLGHMVDCLAQTLGHGGEHRFLSGRGAFKDARGFGSRTASHTATPAFEQGEAAQ